MTIFTTFHRMNPAPKITRQRVALSRPRLEVLEARILLSSFIENFDNPGPPDGRILYRADPIYSALPGSQTGGNSVGNSFENGRIVTSFDRLILSDQSRSGFFLQNRTGGGGGPFTGEVWGTITPVTVTASTGPRMCGLSAIFLPQVFFARSPARACADCPQMGRPLFLVFSRSREFSGTGSLPEFWRFRLPINSDLTEHQA